MKVGLAQIDCKRHRFTLPLFCQERIDLAIKELNRVWEKRCESFNSENKESGGDYFDKKD